MTDGISWNDLLDLVTRLDANEFESVSLVFGGISVRMSRNAPLAETTGAAPVAAPAARPVSTPAPSPDPPGQLPTESPAPAPGGETITSPMIGVFYRRPSPGAPAFVEPGQSVTADTTIGIIEIMKLMNPIQAGVSGVISEFAVTDGEAVEYGQTLAFLAGESS
tara:strand:- start:1796 stop:2287 length:492 start_codon:yes stop_codon:yes gene_type:complete